MRLIRNGLISLLLMPVAGASADDGGEKIFRKACAGCHSVKSEKIRAQIPPGRDLGGIGSRMDAAMLRAISLGEETGVKRHRAFKGSDEDLQALIDWLLAVK